MAGPAPPHRNPPPGTSRGRRFRGAALALAALLASPAVSRAEDGRVDLMALARAGARPKECGGASRTAGNRWVRAKAPGLERYCDVLARGYARLKAAPEAALELSAEAGRLMPSEPARVVLAARAQVALGAFADGFAGFERARALSPTGLESPGALHDFAIAAQKTGHPREALEAYRALAPRAELYDDPREALRVFIEGAVLAMTQGPERLTEAVGYLTEARRLPKLPELGPYLIGALALSLDRQGRHNESAGIAAEIAGPWQLESERGAAPAVTRHSPVLPEGDIDAMIAILAERRDRDLALERWQSYLDGPGGKGPFAAHARARRDALKRKVR
jgi:tetratricopeptide (TPR) repeat protein